MPPKKPSGKPAPRQRELAFQAEVIDLCEGRNLWPVIINPARFPQRVGANQGFPDVAIYGPGGVIYRELKMNMMYGHGLSPAQVDWKYRLKASGQDWGIWTPVDLRDGRIERELAAIEKLREDDDGLQGFALGMLDSPADLPGSGDTNRDTDRDEETGEPQPSRSRRVWIVLGAAAAIAVVISRSR
jgi:hypothetical protein